MTCNILKGVLSPYEYLGISIQEFENLTFFELASRYNLNPHSNGYIEYFNNILNLNTFIADFNNDNKRKLEISLQLIIDRSYHTSQVRSMSLPHLKRINWPLYDSSKKVEDYFSRGETSRFFIGGVQLSYFGTEYPIYKGYIEIENFTSNNESFNAKLGELHDLIEDGQIHILKSETKKESAITPFNLEDL